MNVRLITPILVCCAALAAADTPAPVERFQQALALEEGEGDVKGALSIYLELVKAPETPKGLQVRAELRVAVCRERLGQLQQARQGYDALAARAATWKRVAKAAQAGLARLDAAAAIGEKREPLPQGWLRKNAGKETYDLAVKEADVRTLLLELARAAKLNLVLSPNVMGEVTTTLKGISVRPVMEALVKTVGDYTLVEVDGILRVVSRSSQERLLVTRAYRLRSSDELRAKFQSAKLAEAVDQASVAFLTHRERQKDLARVVLELVQSSSIPGAAAILDPSSETIFVCSTLEGHESAARALKGELSSTFPQVNLSQFSPQDALVSAQFEDASASTALLHLARAAGSPLFVGSDIQGETSLVFHEVPFKSALRAIVETTGDYLVVETQVGPSVRSSSRDFNSYSYRRWPLQGDAARFWRRAHGSLWTKGERQLPGHPVWRAVSNLAMNSGQPGASIQFDPGSHALISSLSAGLAGDLHQALVQAGYLKARPPSRLKGERVLRGANVRALLKSVAEGRNVNVIVSPNVSGKLDVILPKGEVPVLALFEQIAAACGDFTATKIGPRLYRISSRSTHERTVVSEVIAIPAGHMSPTDLHAAISQLVAESNIMGSSVLASKGREGAWSLVVTLPVRDLAEVKALVTSSTPSAQVLKSLAGQTLLVGRRAWTFGSGGSLKVVDGPRPPQKLGQTTTVDGWSLRLIADGGLPRIQIAERKGERRAERTDFLPPPKPEGGR